LRGLLRPQLDGAAVATISVDGEVDPRLSWPLELAPGDEVLCHGAGTRHFFRDGHLEYVPGATWCAVHLCEHADDGMHGAMGAALRYSLAQAGRLLLHGAAVVTPHGACLLLGDSGAGKSTLAAAWMRVGPVVSDDQLIVSVGDDGGPDVVEPFREDFFFRPGADALLPDALRRRCQPCLARGERKTRLARVAASEHVRDEAKIAGLAVLRPDQRRDQTSAWAIPQGDALSAVIASDNFLSVGAPYAPPSLYAAAIRLVSRVPVFALSVGRSLLDEPERAVRHIGELLHMRLSTPTNAVEVKCQGTA
jgi:hypothetical protein